MVYSEGPAAPYRSLPEVLGKLDDEADMEMLKEAAVTQVFHLGPKASQPPQTSMLKCLNLQHLQLSHANLVS